MLNPSQLRSLITAENCNSGLLDENVVRSAADFQVFGDISLGIPILIPADETVFRFQSKDVFSLELKEIHETIYGAGGQIILDLRPHSLPRDFCPDLRFVRNF